MPPPATTTPWDGHRAGSREYRRILFALTCAGVATWAQLDAPQGVLPRIADERQVRPGLQVEQGATSSRRQAFIPNM